MTEYERRLRSNSLFSALLSDPSQSVAAGLMPTMRAREDSITVQEGMAGGDEISDGWMDQYLDVPSADDAAAVQHGIKIGKLPNARRSSAPSGIGTSLSDADETHQRGTSKKKTKKGKKDKQTKGSKGGNNKSDEDDGEAMQEVHVPGSGLPRTLSDPNLRTSHDSLGLRHVERPDGWIGAYSPESRKVRIGRFLAKRNHRVWSKTIKYDVRKNFADSRLRVKGRFVRKEDELLMRELMSLT